MYRPNHDAGGARWPFLFEILMSSLFVGQILMTTMMVLKQAYGPSFFAALPFIPTYLFRNATRSTFLRAYMDASLFHTSELDGLDVKEATSPELRESFRRFLVDAHKAAYIPVCLARGAAKDESKKSYVFTSQPSCVVKHDTDTLDTPRPGMNGSHFPFGNTATSSDAPLPPAFQGHAATRTGGGSLTMPSTEARTQFGVSLRRVGPRSASGVHLNDDGSVTSILTPSSVSPRENASKVD